LVEKSHYNPQNRFGLPALKLERAVIDALRVYENNEELLGYVNEMRRGQVSRLDLLRSEITRVERELTEVDREDASLLDDLRKAGGGTLSSRTTEWLEKRLAEMDRHREGARVRLDELRREEQLTAARSVDARTLRASLKGVFSVHSGQIS
jgi:hypothetical protein